MGFHNLVVAVQCTIAVAQSPVLLLKLVAWVVRGSGGATGGETCGSTVGIVTRSDWAAAGVVSWGPVQPRVDGFGWLSRDHGANGRLKG